MEIDNNDEPIPTIELRNVFKTLENMLGVPSTRCLLEEIENMGMKLSNDKESYSLHEIREVLEVIFGTDVAELLIDRIRKEIGPGNNR